jgi:hypothetical protein
MDKVYGANIPVIEIGNIRFELPRIAGGWDCLGANWTNFRTYDEYKDVGHNYMGLYLDGTVLNNEPAGIVSHIEAHFYDEFPQ